MKKVAILIAALIVIAATAKAFVVVDGGDKSPVIGATVIGKSGIILGQTDIDGRISIGNKGDLPITIRCMGYEQLEYAGQGDTIALVPAEYQLGEVVVSPVERPITRVICFGREYCTGVTAGDTMQIYCEYMAEAFLVDEKVKGYKKSDADLKVRNTKMYARIAKKDGKVSYFRPHEGDDVTMLTWFPYLATFPQKTVEMPQPMIDGAETDTVMGKYAPKIMCHKKNNTFTRKVNFLSDYKSGEWSPSILKLLGMTVDFQSLTINDSYALNDRGNYGVYDFVSSIYNIHMLARGKIVKLAMGAKDPIDMDSFFELFPVEITHCTVEEYKELRSDKEPIPFKSPADLPPLAPAVQSLIERIDQ
ncbi:MAG: hypothetical protein K2N16_03240 [Muribaculaceae bacterium]|nr:hypothetical protein [Muribaculaceae bacterium]